MESVTCDADIFGFSLQRFLQTLESCRWISEEQRGMLTLGGCKASSLCCANGCFKVEKTFKDELSLVRKDAHRCH